MNLFRFTTVIKYELLKNRRRPFIWVILGVTLFMTRALFSSPAVLKIAQALGGSTPPTMSNELILAFLYGVFTFVFYTHVIALIMTDPVEKDYTLGVRELLFPTPVTEREYILGKFLGNFLVIVFIFVAQFIFMIVLQYLPVEYLAPSPIRILPYVKTFLLFNLVYVSFISTLCFWGGTETKNTKLIYAVVTFFYLVVWVPLNMEVPAFAYVDVTGISLIVRFITQGQGVGAFDTQPLPMDHVVVVNRLFTLGVAALVLLGCLKRFGKEDS